METRGAAPGRLQGKVALITGGTSGIGEATVELFVAEGAHVVFTGRDAERGGSLAARLGGAARFVAGDVTDEEHLAEAVEVAVRSWGRLDVLFNNAGGPAAGDLETLTRADFTYAMDLLLGSVLFGTKHAAPVMKRQGGGAIINNSSVAGFRTHAGQYLYSIAKAGVAHATRLAALDLARFGIRVNAISPGAIATPIFFGGHAALADDEARMAKLKGNLGRATPLKRSGRPMDIAEAALFLASDQAGFVNGHDLVVDAGLSVGGRMSFD